MNCPYCGYKKAKSMEGNIRTIVCPRCEYQYEVSYTRIIVEKIISIPFNSLILSPIIFVICYYFAKIAYREESFLSFGALVAFLLGLTAIMFSFVYYLLIGRTSRIFIAKPTENENFFQKIIAINSLLKIAVILVITALFVALYIDQPPF